jgi:proline iminopeptidase
MRHGSSEESHSTSGRIGWVPREPLLGRLSAAAPWQPAADPDGVACHDVRVPEFEVMTDDHCRLWASREGAGEPFVLCHGGPGIADYLQPMDALLGDHFQMIRWDQRGCGRSDQVGPYTLRRSIADLAQVARSASRSPVLLLGHSWGAGLALRYALDYPERVRALVYVSGTGAGHAWKESWRRNVRARVGERTTQQISLLQGRTRTLEEDRKLAVLQWSADFAERSQAVALASRMADPWFPINYDCNAALNAETEGGAESELLNRCQALTVPTLIVDGDCDPRPRSSVDSLYQALPRVHRITMRDVGHVPWLEAPDKFRAALVDFLTCTLPKIESKVRYRASDEIPGRHR